MRTALREFTSEDMWAVRTWPEHFVPSMADRRAEQRIERLSTAADDERTRRDTLNAWLADTDGPTPSSDPAPPATCAACGRSTTLERTMFVPICPRCRAQDEALRDMLP